MPGLAQVSRVHDHVVEVVIMVTRTFLAFEEAMPLFSWPALDGTYTALKSDRLIKKLSEHCNSK